MIRLAFFFSALSLAAVMDIRTRTIPDWLVVLVALTSMLPPGQPNLLGVFAGLPLLLAGITIGGIGGGDVKLMAVTGLLLGWKLNLLAFFLGCIYGAVIHLIRMKLTHTGHMLALGPYLAMGIMTSALFGQQILTWYFSFY